ncbi:hypothetical protein JG687_00010929 [Phytophthora cactorum]|uniref:Uncharacterized protein n=1 Tax=Phytophthora cactorum TaxID=29920 RepID=A0A8T1U5K7_9STRA|nr:hypothetical protein JG687_00010929 [Phytophthora cactorum]
MIASRTHELRLSPSSLHRGNWYGELAPREPCGSPSTSSDRWGPRRPGFSVKFNDAPVQ